MAISPMNEVSVLKPSGELVQQEALQFVDLMNIAGQACERNLSNYFAGCFVRHHNIQ